MANHPPAVVLTLQQADQLRKETLDLMTEIINAHGDFVKVRLAFWDIYLLNHPDYVRHVFLDNWKNYGRRTFQFRTFAEVTGQGLLTTDGSHWQKDRRLLQPAFHRQKIDQMRQVMMRAIDHMHADWEAKLAQQGQHLLDIDAEMLKLGLEIVMGALFSYDLRANQVDAAELSQSILRLMHHVIYRSQTPGALPLFIPSKRNRQFQRDFRMLNQLVAEAVERRRAGDGPHDDLLDLLLSSQDAAGNRLSTAEVRDHMVTMIIAGYETVATGMGWVWYHLSAEEAWQTRLHAAAVTAAAENGADGANEKNVIEGFIQETFRLHPPSWLVTRRALAADTIGPFHLPKGALVVISPFALHRHFSLWDEPGRFKPDRFLFDYAKFSNCQYIPFGFGPHLCIGKPFAMMEATLILSQTVKRFRLTRPSAEPIQHNPLVTLRPASPLLLQLERR